jgi:hypothetical protein
MSPPSSGSNKPRKKPAATYFHAGFLLGLFFNREDGGDVPPKRQLTFNGPHGVIFQKTEILKRVPQGALKCPGSPSTGSVRDLLHYGKQQPSLFVA